MKILCYLSIYLVFAIIFLVVVTLSLIIFLKCFKCIRSSIRSLKDFKRGGFDD